MSAKGYLSLSEYYRQRYGKKVYKVPIDAGFSCPNRTSRQEGGCVYCSGSGAAAAIAAENSHDIATQVIRNIAYLKRRFKAEKFVAYFQAYTNTVGTPAQLSELWQATLDQSADFIGLSVGTRPDCLPDEILDVLCEFSRRGYEVWVELGVQSLKDESLQFIRRGHSVATALDSIARLRHRSLNVCVHVIFGLPTETLDEAVAHVQQLGEAGIDGIKIHMLHILEGTDLATLYHANPFPMPTRQEYAAAVASAIATLPAHVVVQRLTGDAPAHEVLVAPLWIADKMATLREIELAIERLYAVV
ncbi:TIGR01212 family radical SAM protein [Chrysiogenes arsenatis]|uniref:TIGR01212 family radical SAM protein n=1 Tax=Chrysiogenes arsenatis TaxID=309797 RepID=UPI0003F7B912|nr:TIGR01212 family radical SAM protein [Chrysiogenes arsenatis]